MATISNLPGDLVGEILARVPLTSLKVVRSTCKKWNSSSKSQIFGKAATAESKKQFLGFMVMDYKGFSMKFNLQRNHNNDDFVYPSINQISILNQVEIYEIFHCDGLLLCVTEDCSRLLVWNPYLGQTRWIEPIKNFSRFDMYAIGYDNNNSNHKILRIIDDYDHECGREKLVFEYEIYDFSSNSWRVVEVNPEWNKKCHQSGVSLNGNTYFFAEEKTTKDTKIEDIERFLLCFDFTSERFGPFLDLPFHFHLGDATALSCVREEQLAVLYQRYEILEILVTTKIVSNAVLWSKFLKVDTTPFHGFPGNYYDYFEAARFFIDEEKKIVLVSNGDSYGPTQTHCYHTAYIIGVDGYFKSVGIKEAPNKCEYFNPLAFSSYVPSLVQLHINQLGKRKERDY